jgi:hypothetical protein
VDFLLSPPEADDPDEDEELVPDPDDDPEVVPDDPDEDPDVVPDDPDEDEESAVTVQIASGRPDDMLVCE